MHKHKQMKMMGARASSASNKVSGLVMRIPKMKSQVFGLVGHEQNNSGLVGRRRGKSQPRRSVRGEKKTSGGSPALTVRKNGIAMVARLVLM